MALEKIDRSMTVDEIFQQMAERGYHPEGYTTIGGAAINYKAAELNAKATEQLGECTRQVGDMNVRATDRLARTTKLLVVVAALQLIIIVIDAVPAVEWLWKRLLDFF